jgi:hypothetical protein
VYLDDIIVIGRKFQEPLDNLRKVLQKLRRAHLKMNPEKCRLFHKEVRYLVHIVTPGSDDGHRKARGRKMLATTEGQAPDEELPWDVHVLPKVHVRIRRHRQTPNSDHGSKTAFSLFPRS